MSGRFFLVCGSVLLVASLVGCTRKITAQELSVEIPAGFSGNFVLEMGVRDAAPLAIDGGSYRLTLPQDGKIQTSTLLDHPHVTFKNGSDGNVWGYSQRIFTTGDGISVGGKIEFFVGTQQQFEAEQNKKNKSGGFFTLDLQSAAV